MSDLSDLLNESKAKEREEQGKWALERQALEMQLSLFEKHAQLRAGERSGYLWKHGNLLKEWKRRFFFTRDCALWYYRGDLQVKYVDLTLCKATENKLSDSPFAFSIVHSKGCIDLLADSHSEVQEWVFSLTSLTEANLQGPESADFRCADCESRPALWCSLNLGVMLCNECSGVHRSLGSHVSKVRSWNMDRIGEVARKVVGTLHRGNGEIWGLGKVSALANYQEREAYIRRKYIEKAEFRTVLDPDQALATAISGLDLTASLRCIHSGANVRSRSPSFLHLAMTARSQELAELLSLCGADMHARDSESLTVLDTALLSQEPALVSYVLTALDSK